MSYSYLPGLPSATADHTASDDAYLSLQERITQALASLANQPGFVKRNAQRHMIGHIARRMMQAGEDEHPVLAIEAGTGTGKTYGYCLPLIPIAQLKEKRLVISTGTVALQEQLIAHDLPLLKAQTGWEFSYANAYRTDYRLAKRQP